MKKLLFSLLLLTSALWGQIALELKADKMRFMRFEPIAVTLSVTNLSGNTLNFGGKTPDQQGSIAFKIDCTSGMHARSYRGMPNPAAGLQLAPAQTRQVRIILNQYYDMQREDSYTVTAILDHARLPRKHISKPIRLEVQDGTLQLEKNIGLPSEDPAAVIKSVKLSLMRFSDTDEDIYCLRAEDEERVYGVFRLGSFIDGEKPQLELDDSSLIHILLQIRPRIYAYFVFHFDGQNLKMLQKRFYVSSDGAPPALSRETGYLHIEHGKLAREGIDYIEFPEAKED